MAPARFGIGMFAGVLLLAGCAASSGTMKDRTAVAPLRTAALLRFADVPVPVGFQFIDNESFAFQNELARVGLLKYAGRAEIDRVVQFYREQMPLYNWTFLNLLEYESRVLNFEKTDQTCIITIGHRGDRAQVTIAVAPKGNSSRTVRHTATTSGALSQSQEP